MSRASWRGREGGHVREFVGAFGKKATNQSTLQDDSARVLRACTEEVLRADAVALAVARYRFAFSSDVSQRASARVRLQRLFTYMECEGFGFTLHDRTSGWPFFVKTEWSTLRPEVRKTLIRLQVPIFSFRGFPRPVLLDRSAEDIPASLTQHDLPEPLLPDDRMAPRPSSSAPILDNSQDKEREEEDPDKVPPEVLYSGPPPRHIDSYVVFKDVVSRLLAEKGDIGVYNFKDRGATHTGRRLEARCRPSYTGCTRRVYAKFEFEGDTATVHLRAEGVHGVLAKPQGESLWNCAELHALAEACPVDGPITSRMVRDALKRKGLQLRCKKAQLHAYVARVNRSRNAGSAKGRLPIAQLQSVADAKTVHREAGWGDLPLHELKVLDGAHIGEDRVCILWTCRGVLERAKAGQGHLLKLVVDAKQKLVSNHYSVVTLSFLVPSSSMRKTWAGPKRIAKAEAYTGTQEPFLQALVDTESEANLTHIFNSACKVAKELCGLDLDKQTIQVHKDYAKGIDAARRRVFPRSRPCDDYAHMRRASYSALRKHLGGAEGAQAFTFLNRFITVTRLVPCIQLFDTLWREAFAWLLSKGHKAATKYLQKTYFVEIPGDAAPRHFVTTRSSESSVLFAGFWSGILGTYPGTGSGTQTIESFHSYWQSLLRNKIRAAPLKLLDVMSALYSDDWAQHFEWGQHRRFGSWPTAPAQNLLNGQTLRSTGRSTAVDFWQARGQRLCGNHNYAVVHRITDAELTPPTGSTTFHVMRAKEFEKLSPAAATVPLTTANDIVDLITSNGIFTAEDFFCLPQIPDMAV